MATGPQTMDVAESTTLIGRTLSGRWTLLRQIGEGQHGVVLEAREEGSGRRFAVKVLHRELAHHQPNAAGRFIEEARAMEKVQSPHVVRVIDAAVEPELGLPYLVMELLTGSTAQELVDRVGALAPVTAVRIAIQIGRGLASVHAASLIHRDVRPANVFLETVGDVVVAKLCDFGLAKSLDEDAPALTDTGVTLGTLEYLSPEQAKSARDVDRRADVWSLGATLYHLLTATTPYASRVSRAELIVDLCTKPPLHVQDAAPWIDEDLAVVLHGALRTDPAERWSSIARFVDALTAFAERSEEVRLADLVTVSTEGRRHRAPRAELVAIDPISSAPRGVRPEDDRIGESVGKYKLLRVLGRGGMGAVYEAEGDGERYALKMIATDSLRSTDARRRFLREARAASEIDDPNVVAVRIAETDPRTGNPYIVMDLLHGRDLEQLAREGPLDPTATARVFLQACRGVAAAHARGTVHRDLKPANIFLHEDEDEIVVKICDFGIAKTATLGDLSESSSAALTKTGGMLGSPLYMSPEQARNAKHVDTRTDIWSLSISMYEVLGGRKPWTHATTVGELILAICTEELTPLREIAPWVDPELAAVVHRGLERESAKRWPTVAAMAAALEPFTSGRVGLRRADLVSVTASERARAPARGVDPTAATIESGDRPSALQRSTMGSSVEPRSPEPSRGRAPLWVAGALVAVFAVVALTRPSTSSDAPPTTPTLTVGTDANGSVSAQRTFMTIVPGSAEVRVNGAPRVLEGGKLALLGEPGETFHVVATVGSASAHAMVALLKGGVAQPSSLEVPLPAAKESAAKKPGDPRVKVPSTAESTPPAASIAPAPAASPEQPEIKQTW